MNISASLNRSGDALPFNNKHHRSEIDGLRAVSVVSVILFHCKVSGFSGGFLGVDVFFVISGFLITSIIVSDIRSGEFSIVGFYDRRIRRILPALYLVVMATALAGFIFFLPNQLITLGKSILSSSTFWSNIWLSRQTGYFSAPSEMMPLLHTWSLSVEEQFYIAYPLMLYVTIRLGGKKSSIILASVVFTISIYYFIIGQTSISAAENFYLLPSRAWELASGAIISLVPLAPSRRPMRNIFSAFGTILILLAFTMADPQSALIAYYTIFAVLGAVLIILSGSDSLSGTVLGTRFFVSIGLVSYSLYLWHWPILVFSKQIIVSTQLSATMTASLMFLCIMLSYVSWRFVEQPFRRAKVRREVLFGTAALGILSGVFIGFLPIAGSGFPQRFSEASNRFAETLLSAEGRSCLDQSARTLEVCKIGGARASYVVWGDSHAGALFPAFKYLSSVYGKSGILAGFNGCSPFAKTTSGIVGAVTAACAKRNSNIVDEVVKNNDIDTVFITSYWDSYHIDEEKVIDIAKKFEGKNLVVLQDVPIADFNVPWFLALGGQQSLSLAEPTDIPEFRAIALLPNVHVVSLSDAFCAAGKCPLQRDGYALYADSNHVSDYAAGEILGPYLKDTMGAIW